MEKSFNKSENNLETLRAAIERIGITLKQELEEKFSSLEYHNTGHSLGVAKNALMFLENTDTSREDLLLAEVSGLGHDIDQTFTWQPAFSGVGTRRARDTGNIEQASSDYVLSLLKESGLELQASEVARIQESILGTVPGYSPELKTVIQPNVTAEALATTWAIAAADIASSGYSSEQFLRDGDAVFNEDRMFPNLQNLTDDEQEILHKEVLGWTENQISYAEGQKTYWSRLDVPEFIKEKLTEFDVSIELCKQRFDKRKNMPLQQLLDDMNFTRYEPAVENK